MLVPSCALHRVACLVQICAQFGFSSLRSQERTWSPWPAAARSTCPVCLRWSGLWGCHQMKQSWTKMGAFIPAASGRLLSWGIFHCPAQCQHVSCRLTWAPQVAYFGRDSTKAYALLTGFCQWWFRLASDTIAMSALSSLAFARASILYLCWLIESSSWWQQTFQRKEPYRPTSECTLRSLLESQLRFRVV